MFRWRIYLEIYFWEEHVLVLYNTITLFFFLLFGRSMEYLDALIVDVLGGEWKRLIFCELEAQARVATSDSGRRLEILE